MIDTNVPVEPSGATQAPTAISVSAAVSQAKQALEGITVRILGEVSELADKPGYKAVYFTIKDTGASLPCMMWNNRYRDSGVSLRIGALVEVTGRFTLYAPKGRMNFDVRSVTLAGEGNLRMQVAELARKLAAEGLTDSARKRPLPEFPERIGVVTSPRGAAVHDVLRTLRRRYPMAQVLLAGVTVEGTQAPAGIIEGMQRVVMEGAEVVLVVRGGGSFEDLMPFNDENLARAIAGMPVPVITGIGHEPDNSIADMVADVRASTPTAAAESVAPSFESIASRLTALGRNLTSRQQALIERHRIRLQQMAMKPLFTEPERLFEAAAQQLDDLSARLSVVLPRAVQQDHHRLGLLRLQLSSMMNLALQTPTERAIGLKERLRYQGEVCCDRFVHQLGVAASRLHDLSPVAILSRGYAIARKHDGSLVRSIDEVKAADNIIVSVSDGTLNCTVESTSPQPAEIRRENNHD